MTGLMFALALLGAPPRVVVLDIAGDALRGDEAGLIRDAVAHELAAKAR